MSVSLEGLLRDKRLAFLAAWHHRAGNPLMRRCIPKDVAKKIAKEYVTLETQRKRLPDRHRPLVLPFLELSKFVFDLGPETRTRNRALLYYPSWYDRSLSYQSCHHLNTTTPSMKIAFDVTAWNSDDFGPDGKSLALRLEEDNEKHQRFRQAIEQVETQFRNQLARSNALMKRRLEFYTQEHWFLPTIKESERDNFIRLKLTESHHLNMPVFLSKNDSRPLKDAIEEGLLRRGTVVQVIFGQMRVWCGNGRAGITWKPLQIRVISRAEPRIDWSECAFD
jgi:hypothetical protein